MSETTWWPSLEEYNPELTKDKWLEILNNREITYESNLYILACFYDFGGEATCKQLEEKYGNTANLYNSGSSKYAKRIIDNKLCKEVVLNDQNSKRWPVLFVGRDADKGTSGSYVWKLRDELKEACKEFGIEKWLNLKEVSKMERIEEYKELLLENHNIILHGAPGTGKTHLAKDIAKAMNNSGQKFTVQGFESYISAPGYLVKYDNSKETGTVQQYEKVAAKLLEKYGSFEYIAENADAIRSEMQSENEQAGKTGWDNKQIVVNHIKNYVEFARKENGVDSDDSIGFCQFHPSYDYTDFVEGLRPNKNNGFERRDGVFKEFCKKALESNIDDTVDNFEESWQKMMEAVSNQTFNNPFNVQGLGGADFFVAVTGSGDGLEQGEYDGNGNWKRTHNYYYNFDQLYRIYRGEKGVPSGALDNYRKAIVNKMKKDFELSEYSKGHISASEKKNFIFIIDEINRGELSKIFGELFFSIDPGYRGEEGRVNTQYQNLVEDDIFADGFYIPENVYIIGTMNDIDRSVESMDFAMRRRFIFKEVTAEESAENMQLSLDVKNRMKRINDQISATEGLNSAYHIGGAYFRNVTDFDKLWNLKLSSLVKEYLRGMDDDNSKYKEIENAYFGKSDEKKSDDDPKFSADN